MQEKEIDRKETDASSTKSQIYEYRLSLSYGNPIEAEAIRLIRNRDRLDYPTIKLFLLKRILQFQEDLGTGEQTKPGKSGMSDFQKYLDELAREIKSLQKEMADIKENHSQALQEEEPQSSVSAAEETTDDDMDLLGIDDNYADNLLSDME